MPDLRQCERDATGERSSVSLAKIALYYSAHLAVRHFGKTDPYYNQGFVQHGKH